MAIPRARDDRKALFEKQAFGWARGGGASVGAIAGRGGGPAKHGGRMGSRCDPSERAWGARLVAAISARQRVVSGDGRRGRRRGAPSRWLLAKREDRCRGGTKGRAGEDAGVAEDGLRVPGRAERVDGGHDRRGAGHARVLGAVGAGGVDGERSGEGQVSGCGRRCEGGRGARFRLRWIPPGRFWMGSPEKRGGTLREG